jgi:hypothetical protein
MSEPVVHLTELQAALDRCMKEHPPEGEERRMHPDANQMAKLWAPMVHGRVQAVPRNEVKPAVLEAFLRWR